MGAFGQVVIRFRYVVIVAWLVITVLCVHGFPSLTSVASSDTSSFLPSTTPYKQAARLATPFQPANVYTSVLVASRRTGALTAADQSVISNAETKITHLAHVVFVKDQGLSADARARKALIGLDVSPSSTQAGGVVDAIRAAATQAGPGPGLAINLTGQVATNVDNQRATASAQTRTQVLTDLVIVIMLIIVYRACLAPLLTLFPAVLILVLAGPVIARASAIGFDVSTVTQVILTVLVLGAGTDYGLFLTLRMREELARGLNPREAVIESMRHVGESIIFSAGTVIGALLCLLLASFGLYRGLGPGLAIGIGLMLLAALTLLPALLSLTGRATFWPRRIVPGEDHHGAWGEIASRLIKRPVLTLIGGVVLFGLLSLGLIGFQTGGFSSGNTGPSGSDSLLGANAISAHYPPAVANPTTVLLVFPSSVWQNLSLAQQSQQLLSKQTVFQSVSGLLDPNGTTISPQQMSQLHTTLGDAAALPPVESATFAQQIPTSAYNAYRATSQFISADGQTLQFYTALRASSDPTSAQATNAVPAVRQAVAGVAHTVGAQASGVTGQAPAGYDVSHISNQDLTLIIPVVMVLIAILLAIVLRSLVAPLYLVLSVGLSYFAALGLATIIYMHIRGEAGLNFVLPFLMFVFLMALGEDYNILVMTRIREETAKRSLGEAIALAVSATGTTVTSAGLILAATFAVVAITGSTDQVRQLGAGISCGVLLDTFLVRTLLVPTVVALLGRWNWWPSSLARRKGVEASTSADIAPAM